MEKQPTLKELCDDYKAYRQEKDKILSTLNHAQQVEYLDNIQQQVKTDAKEKGLKTVSFDDLFGGDNE